MPHSMSDVSATPGNAIPAVSPTQRWDLLKQALDVDTQQEVADRTGIDLRTLQRMIERPERSIHGNILTVCDASGLPHHILFGRTDHLDKAA